MLRRTLSLVALFSLHACGGSSTSKGPTEAQREAPAEVAPTKAAEADEADKAAEVEEADKAVEPARPEDRLDAYLGAIPSEAPALDDTISGISGEDSDTTVERCKKTGWSYFQCAKVYPRQGLAWVRWECAHAEAAPTRSVLCTRLAEYLYQGVGGPREPEVALALFERQCRDVEVRHFSNCYNAAEALMFDEPERALAYARKGCASPDESPIGCRALLPVLEAGLTAREVVVDQVEGLAGLAAGATCKVWIWPAGSGSCGARMACGDRVIYGVDGSSVECDADGGGGEELTSRQDGDPSFRVADGKVTVRDDASGRDGAFTLRGTLR
ncbi:MAG: hypothetical protein R3B09_06160 [Nannocystaceae bacterium]